MGVGDSVVIEDLEAIDGIEVPPNYLMFSLPTFLLGVAYERVVNAAAWLSAARVNFIGVFRKPVAVQS